MSSPTNVFNKDLKIFFTAYGYREVKSWSCDQCNAFFTCGADIAVDESVAHHLTECPGLKFLKVFELKREIQYQISSADKQAHGSDGSLHSYFFGKKHAYENILSFLESQ